MGRAKEKLVPLEKSRRVIHIEKRGKGRGRISMGSVIFGLLGALCVLYCIAIGCNGFGTKFFLIWGVMGTAFLLVSFALASGLAGLLPKGLRVALTAGFCAGLLLFVIVEGLILSMFEGNAQPGADYCIILGAQWRRSGPSEVLRRRLVRAAEYLRENPDTVAIVSGGQGSNEILSEAEGMRGYLVDAGIAGERILMEDQSTNTWENLAFSAALFDRENSRVVIVTNNFHMFRALGIARKQGLRAEGLAADSVLWMAPNNLLREFVGVMKDFLVGNL